MAHVSRFSGCCSNNEMHVAIFVLTEILWLIKKAEGLCPQKLQDSNWIKS